MAGSSWASLGGYGNVDARMPLPVGQTDNTGVLGMIMQAMLRRAAQSGAQAPTQKPEPDPEAELEMARMLGLLPPKPDKPGY